ncbi:hypothetical protein SCA03_29710 [Streptomyces cacaoi]|uniref:Uncharacterized protein n=1 Tax=Streptomyces cacaoi TaxID=1898 RepID=A0A4Y3R327_STRCI|nr:hypothetical protein SCA03_29710 [Streptomyces cacaoi]
MAVTTETSVYHCECGGELQVNASAWLNLRKGSKGRAELSVFGFSEVDFEVVCALCGERSQSDELEEEIKHFIYGSGRADWFRG